jgi:hypothetical protein
MCGGLRTSPFITALALPVMLIFAPRQMRPTAKFVLCSGASSLVGLGACILLSLASAKASVPSTALLFGDVLFAVPLVLSAYLASKWHWVANDIPLTRASLAILPLLLLPVAFLITFLGWGDPQEHLVRGFLHSLHRVVPQETVGKLVFGISISVVALLVAALVWFSVSILGKAFRAQILLLYSVSSLLLGACSSFAIALAVRSNVAEVIFGVLFFFCFGVLFAVALLINRLLLRPAKFVVPAAGFLICVLAAESFYLFSKSSPEIGLPENAAQPMWTLDIPSAGCTPSYGGPNSFSAPGEMAFANNGILGMAFPVDPIPVPAGGWKYTSCLLSIDAKTGKAIAHKELPFSQPSIAGQADGGLSVAAGEGWVLYSPELEETGNSQSNPEARRNGSEAGLGASDLLRHFHVQSDGTLWYEDGSERRHLAQGTCGGVPRQLNDDRLLFTACTQFFVFDGRGNVVLSQEFVRPKVNFAALSRDHRRFALAVYVWGFGDPSYLEEETIVVYDVASLRPIFAVKSDPLPKQQSWAALSPDGSLLAVGAEHTLHLFRLAPQEDGTRTTR